MRLRPNAKRPSRAPNGSGFVPSASVGQGDSDPRTSSSAFTLIEVMIACGIFFMCMFVIMALVTNALRNARRLQQTTVDVSTAASKLYVQFTTTNQVSEGSGEGDFGDAYPDYSYTWNLTEVASNDLCQLDITVQRDTGSNPQQSKMSMLLYLPNLRNGSMDFHH